MRQPKVQRAGESSSQFLGLPQTPQEYLDVLRLRWPWVLVPLILGAVVSLVAAQYVPKKYVSRTVIMVESERIPRDFIPQLTTERVRDRLRTVEQEVLARPRLERIVDELDPYPELMASGGRAYVVELIRSRTNISVRGRDAFVIEYLDEVPERAQQLTTRLASLFIEETTGARERQVQGANEFIDRQLEQTRAEMAKIEENLRTLKRRYMGMLPEQLNANLSTLQRLQMEQQSIGDKIQATKDRKAMLERQLAVQIEMSDPEAQLIPLSPESGEPRAPSAKEREILELQTQIDELLRRYTEEHPDVVRIQKRIERLETEMDSSEDNEEFAETDSPISAETLIVSEIRAQISGVEQEIENLEQRESEVEGDIRRYQQRVEMIPQVEQELQTLERDYGMISRYYSELLSRKLQAETAGDVERRWKEEQFRVLDPAQLPQSPVFPRKSIFLAVGMLIGLGVGGGLAFLMEYLDHSIKTLRELQAVLPYPLMVALPHVPAGDKGFLARLTLPFRRKSLDDDASLT